MFIILSTLALQYPTNGGPLCRGSGTYGLRGSCRFRFLGIQRGKLTYSLALRTWFMGVLKSLWTPSTACVHGTFWQYHYLRAFSAADTRVPGIKSDWYIYGICAIYGCLAVWQPHQWWWTLYLHRFYGYTWGQFSQSPSWWVRLRVRVEKYAHLSSGWCRQCGWCRWSMVTMVPPCTDVFKHSVPQTLCSTGWFSTSSLVLHDTCQRLWAVERGLGIGFCDQQCTCDRPNYMTTRIWTPAWHWESHCQPPHVLSCQPLGPKLLYLATPFV